MHVWSHFLCVFSTGGELDLDPSTAAWGDLPGHLPDPAEARNGAQPPPPLPPPSPTAFKHPSPPSTQFTPWLTEMNTHCSTENVRAKVLPKYIHMAWKRKTWNVFMFGTHRLPLHPKTHRKWVLFAKPMCGACFPDCR